MTFSTIGSAPCGTLLAPKASTAEQLRRKVRAAAGLGEAPGGVTIKVTYSHGGAASATGLSSGPPPPPRRARSATAEAVRNGRRQACKDRVDAPLRSPSLKVLPGISW